MNSLVQQSTVPSFVPIRGLTPDVTPSQRNGRPFSFTFFNTPVPVTVMTESAHVIVEKNGIFCIADVFEPSTIAIDLEFKGLVDSVMGR